MSESKYLKYRWYALLTMFVVTISQGMALIAPAPLVGEIAKSIGLDLGQVTGAAMGSFILFVALSAMAGGVITDKVGVVKTYFGSLALLIIGSLLVPVLGDSIGGLLVARIIQGCGAGPIMASISRFASEWFPKKERALVTGLQGTGVSLGIAIGFGLAPAIFAKTGSWQIAMAWMASGSVIGLLLTIVFACGPKSGNTLSDEPDLVAEWYQDSVDAKVSADAFKRTLTLPVFWVGVFSAFLLSWTMQGYTDLTPGHLAIGSPSGLGFGAVVAGKYMGLFQMAFMVGSLASGFLVHKAFGGRYKMLISVAFLLTALFCVSVLVPTVHSDSTILLLCLMLSGFFMGMPTPAVMAFISNFYPEHITGRVGGMTMGLSIFGGVIGVAAGSYALHHSGMYTISILIVGVVSTIGAVNAIALNPPEEHIYSEESLSPQTFVVHGS